MKNKLNLYNIDIKYIRDLSKKDSHVFSVSPQIQKENRPFVGILVLFNDKTYCIPLSSPKLKHKNMKNAPDFSKIHDRNNKVIGVLNFNNMIPVTLDVVKKIDIKVKITDTPKDRAYKGLLNAQLDWCNDNIESIYKKASKLYTLVTETPERNRNLTRRCCDFKKLEAVLEKYIEKSSQKGLKNNSAPAKQKSQSAKSFAPPSTDKPTSGDYHYLRVTSSEAKHLSQSKISFEGKVAENGESVIRVKADEKDKAVQALDLFRNKRGGIKK